jgi:tetratricopeptide (TPR) repeat protein
VAARPSDATAAVRLADLLLRLARVESDGAHAIEAERVLTAVLDQTPGEYTALKMLGASYLSQHRFRQAADVARRAMQVRSDDAWTYGVLGDAMIELGEYQAAFDAFDQMARLRPDAAAYARVAYAYELQGNVREALRLMQRAADATGAHDAESLAWHYAQLGHLYLELGDVDAASREYRRADHAFPGHPYAQTGLARVAAARGDYAGALAIARALLERAPTPELAASVGDLLRVTGDTTGAETMYRHAEALEREGWENEAPQPQALARLFAERDMKSTEAVQLAEDAAAARADIFTLDTLAWAYYRAGRLDDAARESARALRTGTGDRRILYHAAAIANARGESAKARDLLQRVIENGAPLDLAIASDVQLLAKRIGARS